ncbi:MAG: hypothetical protein VYD57_03015 [Pseudomonadota bacterium]|nr:hypothetical protein [Pseudomonadota bacterium]
MTTDLSIGMDDHALFTPAINETFAKIAADKTGSTVHRKLPSARPPAALNYLDPKSPYFFYPAGLYSAAFGVYDTRATIITKRDRAKTTIIGDSGGFSAISGALKEPYEAFRAKSLSWIEEQCDVGLILDDPTRSLEMPGNKSKTFQDCLDHTVESMRFALTNRSRGDLILLTVMQGRTAKEAKAWWPAVAKYQNDFEGIALAGDTKLDLRLWMQALIEMRNAGRLDRCRWLHVLGTTRPDFGVQLTGLQRALRKHLRMDFRVSFDSSLAFRIAQVNKQLTTGIRYDRKSMQFLRYTFPDHWSGMARQAPFPFSSPLGDLCMLGDFNPANPNSQTGWDTLGAQMLSNHEVFKEISALREVNRLAAAEVMPLGQTPWKIRKAWEGFDKILSSETPMTEIARYGRFLGEAKPEEALEDDDR